MKTLVQEAFGPPSDLVTQEVEQPVPGPGEALVRVKTAGVGFVDGLMVQGLYQVKPPLPYRPGSEFAGVVTAVGADVQSVQANERVLGLAGSGAFSDYVCVRADSLVTEAHRHVLVRGPKREKVLVVGAFRIA